MPLEQNLDYLSDLDPTSPGPAEFKSEGDDHLRNLKKALRQSFPGATGPILVMGTATGPADAYVLTPARPLVEYKTGMLVAFQITASNVTTAPTLNISSLGAKTIKAVDGAPLAAGDMPANSFQFLLYNGVDFVQRSPNKAYVDRVVQALRNYVDQLQFSSAFPNQAGNAGKVITTDGTNVSWQPPLPVQTGKSGKVLGTDGTTAAWRSVLPKVEVFTVSGTWIATSETARLTLVGGGGSSAGQIGFVRGAGYGAGTGIVTLRNLVIGQSYTVTIGSGGPAITATGNTAPGTAGGTTSFAGPGITAVPTATGGGGGDGPQGPGTASNCDIIIPGGSPFLITNQNIGIAGGTFLSPGGRSGQNGPGYGAGAGTSDGNNVDGGTKAGAAGVVIIET